VRFELTHALHTALAGPRLNHSAKVPLLSKVELLKYINMIMLTVMEEFIPSSFRQKKKKNDARFNYLKKQKKKKKHRIKIYKMKNEK
jgi:hypothetical protein